MKTRFNRLFLPVLLVILLAFTSACGSAEKKTDSSNSSSSAETKATEKAVEKPTEKPAEKPKNTTITMMWNSTKKEYVDYIINQYKSKNPNVQFDVQITDVNQYDNIISTRIATKNLTDLIMHNVVDVAKKYAAERNFVDLSDQPFAQRLAAPEFSKIRGKIYCMPFSASGPALGILYNKKIFSDLQLPIPKNYDELISSCEKMKQKGITPFYFANKAGWCAQLWPLTTLCEFTKGTDIMDKINMNKLKHKDVPEFEKALQMGLDFVKKGYANKDQMSADWESIGPAILSGKYGMVAFGSFAAGAFSANKEVADRIAKETALFASPGVEDPDMAMGSVQGLFLWNGSKNVDEVKKFLEFWSQPENMSVEYKEEPLFSAFKDVKVELDALQNDVYDKYISKGKIMSQYNDQIAVDVTELLKLYQDMYAGAKTPKQVLEAWDKKVEELAKAAKLPDW